MRTSKDKEYRTESKNYRGMLRQRGFLSKTAFSLPRMPNFLSSLSVKCNVVNCSHNVRVAGEPDSVGERADSAEGEDDGDLAGSGGVQQGRQGRGTGTGFN